MVPQSSSPAGPNEQVVAGDAMQDVAVLSGHAAKVTPDSAFANWVKNLRVPHGAVGHFPAVFDASLIVFSSLVGGSAYQFFSSQSIRSAFEPLLGAGMIGALLYVLIGYSSGLYDLRSILSKRRDVARVFAQWSLVGLLLALLAFLMKIGPVFSRGSIVCYALIALGLLLASRRLTKHLVKSAVATGQLHGRRAILLGTREELASLGVNELLGRFGLTEVDRVTFSNDPNSNFTMTESESASLKEALAAACERQADEIVLAFPWYETRKLELIRDRLRSSPLPAQLLPDRRVRSLTENPSFRVRRSYSIEVKRGPLSRAEQFVKRVVDVVGASIALVLLAPLMVMAALAIKFDSTGPVFFRQKRKGFNAKQFAIIKFRSMTVMEDGPNVVQATRFDSRVTRIGRILRRSSIDELPQLFNVLFGDMSLVGPRPHALAHDDHYGDLLSDYAFRHHVKPGITGWAQVRGFRGETARVEQMKGRVDCDLWYINNWSLALDFKIMMLTCFELTRRRNAY